MATKQKLAAGGVAGVVVVEEYVIWLIDRIIDVALAYKDVLFSFLS